VWEQAENDNDRGGVSLGAGGHGPNGENLPDVPDASPSPECTSGSVQVGQVPEVRSHRDRVKASWKIVDHWWRKAGIIYQGVDLGEVLGYDLFQLVMRQM
jgi:hypothetical protein